MLNDLVPICYEFQLAMGYKAIQPGIANMDLWTLIKNFYDSCVSETF